MLYLFFLSISYIANRNITAYVTSCQEGQPVYILKNCSNLT